MGRRQKGLATGPNAHRYDPLTGRDIKVISFGVALLLVFFGLLAVFWLDQERRRQQEIDAWRQRNPGKKMIGEEDDSAVPPR